MTLVNIDTGEVISYGDVVRSIEIARSHAEKFFEQIVWQVENQVWSVLGYSTWEEMREAKYSDMGAVVPRGDRPELVARLRARDLTQQEIADTLGVNAATVNRDLKLQMQDEGATVTNKRGQNRPATYKRQPEPDVVDAEVIDDGPPNPTPGRYFHPETGEEITAREFLRARDGITEETKPIPFNWDAWAKSQMEFIINDIEMLGRYESEVSEEGMRAVRGPAETARQLLTKYTGDDTR